MQDHFKEKAHTWDAGAVRVHNTRTIAEAISQRFALSKEMHLMDFGVGTGLLGFEIRSKVGSMVGVDTSKSMLEKLDEKNTPECYIKPCNLDILKEPLYELFDGIISSMTLHHVEHLEDFFTTIKRNLKPDGFIAIADLELEDGTFHGDNTGVYHFGFDGKKLQEIVLACGYRELTYEQVHSIQKPNREFGVFLLTARAL